MQRNSWSRHNLLVICAVLLIPSGCGQFQKDADGKFGDQNFKTASALIELYKVRHGAYPEKLSDLDFIGDWDQIALGSVEYHRLADGYELNVTRGWVGKPTLEYPAEFWNGLGIRKSNVGHSK